MTKTHFFLCVCASCLEFDWGGMLERLIEFHDCTWTRDATSESESDEVRRYNKLTIAVLLLLE